MVADDDYMMMLLLLVTDVVCSPLLLRHMVDHDCFFFVCFWLVDFVVFCN